MKKAGTIWMVILLTLGLCLTGAWGTQKVTITVQGWAPLEKSVKATWDKMEPEFERLNPGIDVKIKASPWEQTRQQAVVAVAGGKAPDIAQYMAGWVPQMVAMGALAPLDEYYTQEELKDIPKMVMDAMIVEGKIYSVVWNAGPLALICHKGLWDKAGFSPGTGPETWDEFDNMIVEMSNLKTETGKKVYGYGCRTSKSGNSAFWFFPVMWAFGGRFVNEEGEIVFNSPQTIEALNWYQKLAENKYTPMGLDLREVRSLFTLGQTGIILEGPWMRGNFRAVSGKGEAYDDEYFAAVVPKGKDGKRHPHANNQVFILFEQSKHKDAAMKLIKFVTQNKEIADMFYREVGYLPALESILASELYQDDFSRVFVKELPIANTLPSKHPQWLTALEFVAVAMQKALLGKDTHAAAEEAERSIKILYGQE